MNYTTGFFHGATFMASFLIGACIAVGLWHRWSGYVEPGPGNSAYIGGFAVGILVAGAVILAIVVSAFVGKATG